MQKKIVLYITFTICLISYSTNIFSQDSIRSGNVITITKKIYHEDSKNLKRIIETKYYSYKDCLQFADATCKYQFVITDFDVTGNVMSAYKRKGKSNSWGYKKEKCYKKIINNGKISKYQTCLCSEIPNIN